MSGFRYVNGYPGETPVRPNLSIGDTISGIHAALGIAMALLEKQRSGSGQVVDVALLESMYNLMEAVVPEYDGNGSSPMIHGSPRIRVVSSTRRKSMRCWQLGVRRRTRSRCCRNWSRRGYRQVPSTTLRT